MKSMISTVLGALQRCEALIVMHDINLKKYEILLSRTARSHPCFESVQMLLEGEQKKLKKEKDYRLRLLGKMYAL